MRTCGHFGYTATCPQPWSQKTANCMSFAVSLAPLLICWSNLSWQIDGDPMQQLRETLVYLKPHDSVQRPWISKYGLKAFLCIFWNSSGVLQNRLLETILMETPYVNYHKLTKVAYKYYPTTPRYRKLAGLHVCKTMLVSTRQIKESPLFYIELLRLSPLNA